MIHYEAKKFLGRGHSRVPRPIPIGEGAPPPQSPSHSAPRDSRLRRSSISIPNFKDAPPPMSYAVYNECLPMDERKSMTMTAVLAIVRMYEDWLMSRSRITSPNTWTWYNFRIFLLHSPDYCRMRSSFLLGLRLTVTLITAHNVGLHRR